MSAEGLFNLAIIFHLVSILLGGILLSKACAEREAATGLVVLIIGILIQGLPTGMVFLYSTKPGMGDVLWLLIPFGLLDAAAAFLWVLVGLGIFLLTKGRPEAT
ncbi:hypothetical protein [Tardiphaga sp. 367_B4_N1_1]|uniref:hypothetical protein n=1 Tax=Tardiphaga sp. 367_B4_N1_1 TaxID=3240777 RepID=UPI003F285585